MNPVKFSTAFWLFVLTRSDLLGASSVFAEDFEVIVVEAVEKTAADIPLKFEVQKTTWKYGRLYIWGKVSNPSDTVFDFVRVNFTCTDKAGNFLGRGTWHCDPYLIGPKEVGYIDDKHLETEKRKPAKVEYKVVGKSKK